jgi:hypothetical protein
MTDELASVVLREQFGLPGPVPTVSDAVAAMPRPWLSDRQRSFASSRRCGPSRLPRQRNPLHLRGTENDAR